MSLGLTTTDLLGPLTTLFTPPVGCLATVTSLSLPTVSSPSLSPSLYLGATWNAVDPVCYPPNFSTDHIYSPGVCPSGWTSACEPMTADQTYVGPPTTAIQCCPTGMTCTGFNWCFQSPTSTYRAAWLVSQDVFGFEASLTSAAFPSNSVYAKPIVVAYQSSDQAVLAAATALASGSTATSASVTSSLSSTSAAALDSQKKDLSGGSIAGIAVGAAIGGGVIIGIATFLLFRFCFGYRKLPTREKESTDRREEYHGQVQEMFHWQGHGSRSELSGKPPVRELSDTHTRVELDGLPASR